jgi:hypothetical protein
MSRVSGEAAGGERNGDVRPIEIPDGLKSKCLLASIPLTIPLLV